MKNLPNFFELCNFSELTESSVLKSKDEISFYSYLVKELGFEGHHDFQKNWDTLKSFLNIAVKVHKDDPILDAGSSGNSAILRWLTRVGYKNLYACDLREKNKQYTKTNVQFSIQDLTKTNYPDSYFSSITCISVIEHGVDILHFFNEMRRICKIGGQLLVSTDYWDSPISTDGIYPYGENFGQMKVMNKSDIVNLIEISIQNGFKLKNNFSLETNERCVRWERVNREYTFIFMCFERVS